jgi:hypothetical protein
MLNTLVTCANTVGTMGMRHAERNVADTFSPTEYSSYHLHGWPSYRCIVWCNVQDTGKCVIFNTDGITESECTVLMMLTFWTTLFDEVLFSVQTLRLFFTLLSQGCMFVLRVSACFSFHVCNIYSAHTPEGLTLAFIRVSNQARESRVDLCTVLF